MTALTNLIAILDNIKDYGRKIELLDDWKPAPTRTKDYIVL
jgi:hypothetical protein